MVSPKQPQSSPIQISGNTLICQIWGKANHVALEFWKRFDHSYQTEEIPKALAAMAINEEMDPAFYVDSGATSHTVNDIGII